MDSLLIALNVVIDIIELIGILIMYALLFSSLLGLFVVAYIFWYVTIDYRIKNPVINFIVVYIPIIIVGIFLFGLGENAFEQFPLVVKNEN